MKIVTPLIAAGFVVVSLAAANAESGFETRNGVPNAPENQAPVISQLTSAQPESGHLIDAGKQVHSDSYYKTSNEGFLHGYTTFDVLDSIR